MWLQSKASYRKLSLQMGLLICLVPFSGVWAMRYQTGLTDTVWKIEQSIHYCRFYQEIPLYGEVAFFHRAGEALEFYLQVKRNLMATGSASLTVQAPAWRSSELARSLGEVTVVDHSIPIRVEPERTGSMIEALMHGLTPTFTRQSRYSDEIVAVGLSPVGFSDQYDKYLECQAQLLPVNFAQIEYSRVLFPNGGDELDQAARQQLDLMITYVKADPLINAIYIDGHSDSVGSRYHNRRLSERRAYKVTDYLVAGGLDVQMMLTRYHGERYLVASEATAAGRAANRRVTVRFERIKDDPNDPLLSLPNYDVTP